MQALLIDLRGSLCAWGDVSIGDNREVTPYPTATAIMGLLGAVCGLDRRDRHGLQTLYESWELASLTLMKRQGDKPQPFKAYDYQTAMYSLKLDGTLADTVIGYKAFYQDSFSVAALILRESANRKWLEWGETGFKNPVYIPYLGRVSNPLSMLPNPARVEFSSSRELLEKMQERMQQSESFLCADYLFPQRLNSDGLDAVPIRLMDRRMGWKKYFSDNDYWKHTVRLSEKSDE